MANSTYKKHKNRNQRRGNSPGEQLPEGVARHEHEIGQIDENDVIDVLLSREAFHDVETLQGPRDNFNEDYSDSRYQKHREVEALDEHVDVELVDIVVAAKDNEVSPTTLTTAADKVGDEQRVDVGEFMRHSKRNINQQADTQDLSRRESLAAEEKITEYERGVSPVQMGQIKDKLADINEEITLLKHELAEQVVSLQEMMAPLADAVKGLQVEQAKLKRQFAIIALADGEQDAHKKPVLSSSFAVVAAMVAVVLAAGFGFMGFRTKSKVTEVFEMTSALKNKIDVIAVSQNNVTNESEHNLAQQLDELKADYDALVIQVATLGKTLQSNPVTNLASDNLTKKLSSDGGSPDSRLNNSGSDNVIKKIETVDKKSTASKMKLLPSASVSNKLPSANKKAISFVTESWNVHLMASEQEDDAQRKAVELNKKGIPALISKMESKGKVWYRLSVKGFKTQKDAEEYVNKIKKTQHLTSAWVTKN